MEIGIDHEPGRLDPLDRIVVPDADARSPQRRLHPRHQLRHPERLGQVVVGAQSQSVHLVLLRTARADHDHRHLRSLGPQTLGDLPAVHARQHQVDDRDVGPFEAQFAHRLVAGRRDLDGVARVPQMRCHHDAMTLSSSAIRMREIPVMLLRRVA